MSEYVKREDVIALAFWEWGTKHGVVAVSDILTIPAADVVERKRGEWIVPDEHYPYTCSNCLFEFVWDGDDDYRPNYCPNCGADMRGE